MSTAPAVLHPVVPLPGLPAHPDYSLDTLDDEGILFAMRSLADPDVRLFVVRPEAFFDGYTPAVDAQARAELALGDGSEPLVLVVVHPATAQGPATANLLAPLLVNPATGAASQVVLDGWPLRAPLG